MFNEGDAPERRRRYRQVAAPVVHDALRGIDEAVLPRAGSVLSVGPKSVRVDIPGLTGDDGLDVPLPDLMPGALLEAGANFVVLDDGRPIERLRFLFDEVAYMSDEDADAEFAALTFDPIDDEQ